MEEKDCSLFEAVYEQHSVSVFRFAWSLTRDQGEAEELFQETWLRVVRNIKKIKQEETVKAWLFAIVANLHRDSLRRKKIRRLFLARERAAIGHTSREEGAPSGNEAVGESEEEKVDFSRAVLQAIECLPEKQRRVFILREMEGLKYEEIGEVLRMPLGTVKSLLFRAVRRLRQDLWAFKPGG